MNVLSVFWSMEIINVLKLFVRNELWAISVWKPFTNIMSDHMECFFNIKNKITKPPFSKNIMSDYV